MSTFTPAGDLFRRIVEQTPKPKQEKKKHEQR